MDFLDTLDIDFTLERTICSQFLIRLKPTFSCLARSAEHQEPPIAFEEPFLDELLDRMYSYENKIYVMEREGRIWCFVPTFFPASSMALAIRLDVSASVALRCLSGKRYRDILEFSPNIKAKKSRSTKLADIQAKIDALLNNLNDCFFEPYESVETPDEAISAFEARCICFSRLIGTPVRIERSAFAGSEELQGEIDFAFLSAFLTTFLLLAREFALDRSVIVSFRMLSQSVAAVVRIIADEADLVRAVALWDGMCADLFMPFGAFSRDGVLTVGFQPCRRELSYLGLKQRINGLCLYET